MKKPFTALVTLVGLCGVVTAGLLTMPSAAENYEPANVAAAAVTNPGSVQTAIFAGGCFWCTEADFEKVDGVTSAVSGYIGGKKRNPSYKQVSAGRTQHTEAVQVVFDPAKVSYQQLLKVFWRSIDPLAKNRQFCDSGKQYRSGIFYLNEQQGQLAQASKSTLEQSGVLNGKIQTEITAASEFWEAEQYHQDYYLKNPVRYRYYRGSCGREKRLKEIWGNDAGWKPAKAS